MVALTGSLVGCVEKDSESQNEDIRIGAIVSLSGTYASMGQAQINALKLEVEAINNSGGIEGKPIKLIIEDDATTESKAVSAASKLILRDKVEVILGASGTGSSMAIRQIVENNHIPQISMAGGNVITSEFSDFVFQTPWPNELLITELFKFLEAEGYSKIAFVSDSGAYGKDGVTVAKKVEPQTGIDIILETTFKPQDTDMSSQVALLKNSDAEALVIWNAGKEASLFVNQLRNSGVTIPIFGGSGMAREEFSEGVGSRGEGVTILTGKSFIPESWDLGSEEYRVNKDFEQRYKASYNVAPDIFAGHAYDALHLAVNALRDNEVSSLEANTRGFEIINSLERNKLVGYAGVFEFTQNDRNGLTSDNLGFYHINDEGMWSIGLPSNFDSTSTYQESSNFNDLSASTLRNAAFYALVALGYLAVYMATGAINFAQGQFVALAGLIASALFNIGFSVFAALGATLIIMALFGLAFHRILIAPLSKMGGSALVIITVGASIFLQQTALHIFGPDERSFPAFFEGAKLELGNFGIDIQTLILIFVSFLAFGLYAFILSRTKLGKAMRAYSNEREGAQYCGVNPSVIVGFSFMLAAMLGALAGVLITPISQMAFDSGTILGVKGFSVAILGGLSKPLITPIAALILSILETLTGVFISPVVKEVIAFIILIAVLIFRPKGLFSRDEKSKL